MAISQRGTPTRAGFGNGTTVSVTEPAGAAQDDVEVTAIVVAGSVTITPPAGWSATVTQTLSVDSQFKAGVYHIVRGSSAPALQFTYGGASIYREAINSAWTGCDTTTPINNTAVSTSGNRTNPDCPSVTPSVNDCEILAIGFNWAGAGSGTWGAPTNYTISYTDAVGDDTVVAARLLSGGSGAGENPAAYTGGNGSDDTWEVTVALAPPAAGGRTTKNTRAWPLGMEIGMDWRNPC